jgi:competence protein ComEC
MPLLWISAAFIAGAAVPFFQPFNKPEIYVICAILFLVGLFEKRLFKNLSAYTRLRKKLPIPVCLFIASFLGGIVRGEAGRPVFQSDNLAYYNGRGEVTILAEASQPVENHDKSTLLTVSSRLMKVGDAPAVVTGEAVILLPAGSVYEYGDLLEVSGIPESPPEREDFSYRQYLENRGVYTYMAYPRIIVVGKNSGSPILAVIYKIRDHVAQTVKQIMPQPEAAFLSGILVGRDEDISDDLKKAFQSTGTSHLVAISGFNITIGAGLILALAGRLLPKRWSVWAAIVILTIYTVMAGASPSVVRAAIMGALAMIGHSIGRNRTAVNSLGLAVLIMVLVNPLILRDIGFQLSVAATAGILLIGAPLNDWFVARKTSDDNPAEVNTFWRTVGDSVVITLAAQITTVPFLLFHFHRYPLIGLLVNPFVLPVQPAAMILGG